MRFAMSQSVSFLPETGKRPFKYALNIELSKKSEHIPHLFEKLQLAHLAAVLL